VMVNNGVQCGPSFVETYKKITFVLQMTEVKESIKGSHCVTTQV